MPAFAPVAPSAGMAGTSRDRASSAARIGFGEVRHRRLAPVDRAFVYPTCFVLLPMRTLRAQADPVLARNRRAMFGFRDADHGDGGSDSLAWLDALLAREGVHDADGEAWLHCIPRMFGFAFKPVSFWYAHRADGTLAAVVVEVNNTFGERHCYLLAGADIAFGRTIEARKVFHVSPFCETRGDYAFRFMRTDLDAADGRGRTAVRIELSVAGAPLLVTSVSGKVEPLTRSGIRFALLTLPAMTAAIVVRIHWQALRLWLRGATFVPKPAPPASPVSRRHAGDLPVAGGRVPPAATAVPTPLPPASGTSPGPVEASSVNNPA